MLNFHHYIPVGKRKKIKEAVRLRWNEPLHGKVFMRVHRVCHSLIHMVFTNEELKITYNNKQAILRNPIIQEWVKRTKEYPSIIEAHGNVRRLVREMRRNAAQEV
jgi:hypothetical protein